MTPLQFALIRGNTELALELIKAGLTTDQVNTGWKSSALVLAIIGDRMRGYKKLWGYDDKGLGVFEDGDTEEYEARNARYDSDDHLATQEATDRLFNLICCLINAGAAINLSDIGQLRPTELEITQKLDLLGDGEEHEEEEDEQRYFYFDLNEVHSPLSVASKCQRKDIVDLLIQNGADVKFLTDQGTSALHECLYSRDQMNYNLVYGLLSQFQERNLVSQGCKSLHAVVDVARSLIMAGANVHEEFNCVSMYSLYDDYSGPTSYTIFDLGVIGGSIEVVNMLISAGAHMTELSVTYAIRLNSLDILNHLLDCDALVSTDAIIIATRRQDEYQQACLTKREHGWIKETALLEAIHWGCASIIKYLLKDRAFVWGNVLYMSAKLTKAIESCCREGHIGALCILLHNSVECQFSLSPWFGDSPFFCLAILKGRDEVIDTLLSAGADVNAMAHNGQTPLLAAIKTKNKRMLERLMELDAKLNPMAPYSTCCSRLHGVVGDALIAAIEWGDSVVVNRLIERGADIEAFGTTRYHQTYRHVYDDYCFCIRPITAALEAKDLVLVHDLIRRGVKINNPLEDAFSPRSRRPLHISHYRITPLAAAIRVQDSEMVDFIIQKGANPYDRRAIMETKHNHKPRRILLNAIHSGNQPSNIKCVENALVGAMEMYDIEMVRAILCSPLWDIKSGLTLSLSLQFAITLPTWTSDMAARVSNCPRLVKILLEAGAEANTSILFGRCYSPLQSAVKERSHEIAQVLLDYGSNPNSLSNPNSVSVDTEVQKDDYRTPLQIAVKNQDVEMIKILFHYKADVNGTFIDEDETNRDNYIKSYLSRMPLQEACLNGGKEIVELLLDHGAYC